MRMDVLPAFYSAGRRRVLSAKPGLMRNRPHILLPTDERQEKYRNYGREKLDGNHPPGVYEGQLLRRDGKLLEMLISKHIINFRKIPVIMAVARDVTDQKRTEEELREPEAR